MKMHSARVESPIGDILIEGNDDSITRLGRIGGGYDSDEWVPVDRFTAIKEAAQQLDAYWAGELFDFDLPLAPGGTPFQNKVWGALRTIPYGKTASYGDIAKKIGSPTASRAVGAANGRNPIAIVVPCHRVIGANGTLTGYAGGLDMKRQLLAHETRFVRS
jgi:methylated-DNA-[protein]-cysteine S-methyltransferase